MKRTLLSFILLCVSMWASALTPMAPVYVVYTSSNIWTYTQYAGCFGAGSTAYGLTTTWDEIQHVLMNQNALPEEFEKNYLDQDGNAGPLYQDPSLDEKGTSTLTENPDEAQQYIVKRNSKGEITGYELVKNTAQKIGVITYIPDENLQGTRTSVFKWEIDPETAIELFGKNKSVEIACKLKSQSGTYPDIYVIFKSDPSKISFNYATVTGGVNLDPHKITNYWYFLNSNSIQGDGGLTEIHAHTQTPEDFFDKTANSFDATFADVFLGNFKTAAMEPNQWISISTTIGGSKVSNHSNFANDKIKTDFIFETAKQFGSFKGYYKTPNKLTTFKLFASDLDQAAVNRLKMTDMRLNKGKNLYAYVTSPADAQLIATIEGDDLATMQIKLNHSKDNAGYIEAMLNYKARSELADDVLKAVVSLKAWIELERSNENPNGGICEIPLTNNSFLVRFLRPINIIDQSVSFNYNDFPQTVFLEDLLSFSDWRGTWQPIYNATSNKWEGLDYKSFYGVQSIKIQNVEIGDDISSNTDVKTTLNQSNGMWVPLSEIGGIVECKFLGKSQFQVDIKNKVENEFKIQIPIEAEYLWGTVQQNVTMTIVPSKTYSMIISVTSGGTVSYNGNSISNGISSYSVDEGGNAILFFSPQAGYRLKNVKENGVDVTSQVSNNQYTISNITGHTTIVVTFEEIPLVNNFEVNGIYYNMLSHSTVEVTQAPTGKSYSRDINIPSTIVYEGLEYTVVSIGKSAFYYSSKMTSVNIPASVKIIEDDAFYSCSGLTSVTIPNSVNKIGSYAFDGCFGLTSITIPNSVTSIGSSPIRGCKNITIVEVEGGNPKYDSRNNCNAIIESSSNTLISGCKKTIIPNGVTSIGSHAFFNCSGLTSITMPNSVTTIGSYAFQNCI